MKKKFRRSLNPLLPLSRYGFESHCIVNERFCTNCHKPFYVLHSALQDTRELQYSTGCRTFAKPAASRRGCTRWRPARRWTSASRLRPVPSAVRFGSRSRPCNRAPEPPSRTGTSWGRVRSAGREPPRRPHAFCRGK